MMQKIPMLTKFAQLSAIPVDTNIYVIGVLTSIVDNTVYGPEVNYRCTIRLYDGTKTLSMILWKPIEIVDSMFGVGKVYQIYGTKQEYNGRSTVRFISSTEVKDEKVLKKYALTEFKRLTFDNRQFFVESIRKIEDFRLRRLVEVSYGLGRVPSNLTAENYAHRWEKQLNGAGSIARHDNYSGGIINHICGMLRQVDALEGIYGNRENPPLFRVEKSCTVNWDIVRVLVYLHDLGKQETYTKNLAGSVVFKAGTQLTHEQVSLMLVSKYMRDVDADLVLPYSIEQQILKGIASHGSFSYEKSPEEQILAVVDLADAVLVDALDIV